MKICNAPFTCVADCKASANLQRTNRCIADFQMQIFSFFVVNDKGGMLPSKNSTMDSKAIRLKLSKGKIRYQRKNPT